MTQSLNIYELLEVCALHEIHEAPPARTRGRPPLTVKNPLDDVPFDKFITPEGQPKIWLDDVLTGAIRALACKDVRKTTRNDYVSKSKVLKALCVLSGSITPKRVAEALFVSRDTGWRITSAIALIANTVSRPLNNPNTVTSYKI